MAEQPTGPASRVRTVAGVGWSENPSSRDAGAEAVRMAMERADTEEVDLVLLFTTSKHDPHAVHEGARAVAGPEARLIGGYTVGVITNDFLAYEGHQVGAAVLASDTVRHTLFLERSLDRGEHEVGRALGQRIRAADYDGEPNLVFMYDGVRSGSESGMALNMATPLIEGMQETLGEWPRTAGLGMFGDLAANPTWQFFDDGVHQQAVAAWLTHGGLRMDSIIMHGCKPSGAYHTITATDGPVVLEIDGKPALEMVETMLGPGVDIGWEEYPLFVTLGVNKGEKFGPFHEEEYANRLCMAVDTERKALVMFEPDLVAGSDVQLMRRSMDFEYIGRRAHELLSRLNGRVPVFALYIDCAGRAATYAGTEREEAEEVQRAMGDIPLFGMYTGVEIARVGPQMQALDWTGVLCVFSEAGE